MTKLNAEAATLRRLLACDDFAGAIACSQRYTSLLKSHLKNLPPSQAQICLREACSLLEWARRSLCASRAGLSDELHRVHRLAAYHLAAKPGTVHTWRLEG